MGNSKTLHSLSAFSSAVQCSLIEEKSDENFDVEEDEEDEDINDDQESSSSHYSCHGEKEDEEW